jgi:hypothetical protein
VVKLPLFAATTVLAVGLAGAGAASAKPPSEAGLIVEAPHTIVVHEGDTEVTIPFSMTNVTPFASVGDCVFGVPELGLFGSAGPLGVGETASRTVVIDVPSDRITRLTLSLACFPTEVSNEQSVMIVRTGPLSPAS